MFGKNLVVFQNLMSNELFSDFMVIMELQKEGSSLSDDRALLCSCINRLMDFSSKRGYYGNLFHCFLTDLIVNDENFFSLTAEKRGKDGYERFEGLLNADMEIFDRIFSFDFDNLTEALRIGSLSTVLSFEGFDKDKKSPYYSRHIRDRIVMLSSELASATEPRDMINSLICFYDEAGVGEIGLHKAFRINGMGRELEIEPIRNITHVHLNDLIGYNEAKAALVENTEAFLNREPANNCLLYGDAGTGKSTSIKALANEYYSRGLRIIEVYRHQFKDLHKVMSLIKNRNYRFIIYLDDLSFEEFETEYKYLKAVIEGGLEVRPENILIYATSNRRHLVRESFRDREEKENDLHSNDTVQEKLSLASRFGTSIYYGSPDRKEYYDIVKGLAQKAGIKMSEKDLLMGADRFELIGNGRSGRTARQYIDTLMGQSCH